MNIKKYILILIVLLFASCSANNEIISGKITKRKYQKGYYVVRKSNDQDDLRLYEIHNLTASNNINELLDYSIPPDTLDTILKIDSTLIKIEELKILIELEELKKQYNELKKQNEEKEIIPLESEQNLHNDNWKYPKVAYQKSSIDPFGILSLISSLIGAFFFSALVCGIIAVVFSFIAIGRISYDPNRWKGKGFAILGLLIGIVDIVIIIGLFL